MRGAPIFIGLRDTPRGIIPALAGSTGRGLTIPTSSRDHPRACGEHVGEAERLPVGEGSSPRLRGAQKQGQGGHGRVGIIPALAGSTMYALNLQVWDGDHPRACGEHDDRQGGARAIAGSSPRLRGAHDAGPRVCWVDGIIPALAGSTPSPMPSLRKPGDHPRACGEHPKAPRIQVDRGGSSPRLRGAHMGWYESGGFAGIIPALAGSTRCRSAASSRRRDHPRACGEHHLFPHVLGRGRGSSPRLRGALSYLVII